MYIKLKVSQYAKQQGCSTRTVWRRIKAGELMTEKTETGRVFILLDPCKGLKVAVYARVSSSENRDNLIRQKDRLVSYCNAKGYKVEKIVTEIGSGLNDKRLKLESLLLDPNINLIVVEHKDRLARFGFNYLEKLLNNQGKRIEVINCQDNDERELMEDFVSIITSFTARLYGKRRSKRKTERIIQELLTQE